jgi:hypothetical protein
MVGRKQRGPSRGGRAIDRGRGRSRGRGRGRGQYRSQDDAGIQEIDAAFDDVDSRMLHLLAILKLHHWRRP